jgi:6-phosphogluconolactonase (cycloisomerase 2 family)
MKTGFCSVFLISIATLTACGENVDSNEPDAQAADEALIAPADVGAVFTMNNSATGNAVLTFRRGADGTLESVGETPTGGMGTGSALGSQGSVTLSEDGRFLLVVNAGSDEISSLAVHGTQLTLRAKVSSGGKKPTSIAERNHLVYVLNAGQASNVSGFWLDARGSLVAIPSSTRQLSADAPGAAQVAVAPRGLGVVVTEKATNLIDTFALRRDGTLDNGVAHPSSGEVPYGFDFTSNGMLVVSEAKAGAVSSYTLNRRGAFTTVTASATDNQVAPCWLVVTKDGRFAYTANAGSSSISAYAIHHGGGLNLLDSTGVTASMGTNSKPLDLALDRGHHLYAVDAGNHVIDGFAIDGKGALTPVAITETLPSTIVGIAAM